MPRSLNVNCQQKQASAQLVVATHVGDTCSYAGIVRLVIAHDDQVMLLRMQWLSYSELC